MKAIPELRTLTDPPRSGGATMFSNPLGWRLRRRRRSPGTALGLDSSMDLDDMIEVLCRWGASMPWAVELPASHASEVRHGFVVDCPVLGCRRPWFAVDALATDLENGPEVVVILPSSSAQRGAASEWAARVGEDDGCCAIMEVALPTTLQELSSLQGLLEVAYSAAFDHIE
jgi:hypothetical protein